MSPRSRRRGSSGRPQQRNRRQRGAGGGGGGSGGNQRRDGTGFWGDPAKLPEARSDIRTTDDSAAVARSLGAPPLAGHEAIAEHYFAAVYDRAVTLAGALAAAGGLIEPETLIEESSD
jgi:hypothetical protein